MQPRLAHCLQRLWERYGLAEVPAFVEEHERLLRAGLGRRVGQTLAQAGRENAVYAFVQDGQEFFAAVDERNGRIVTYLSGGQAAVVASQRAVSSSRRP